MVQGACVKSVQALAACLAEAEFDEDLSRVSELIDRARAHIDDQESTVGRDQGTAELAAHVVARSGHADERGDCADQR